MAVGASTVNTKLFYSGRFAVEIGDHLVTLSDGFDVYRIPLSSWQELFKVMEVANTYIESKGLR